MLPFCAKRGGQHKEKKEKVKKRKFGLTCAVSGEDHCGNDRPLGVSSNVGTDHDETESETDRLNVDEPERDESSPGV